MQPEIKYTNPVLKTTVTASVLALTILLWSLQLSAEQRTPQQLLQLMDSHAAEMSYSGTLVYSQGKRMETLKLYHAVVDGVRRERLVHLSGKQRETIRKGEEVVCLDDNGVRRLRRNASTGPFAKAFSDAVLAEDSLYRVVRKGESRVAGRPVIQLALIPRDSYRYGYQLALDAETQLLMQWLMLDEKGEIVERYEFSEISIGEPIEPSRFQSQLTAASDMVSPAPIKDHRPKHEPGKQSVTEAKASHPGTVKRWRVNWIPQGFMVQPGFRAGKIAATSPPALTSGRRGSLMYSDGLSGFTVFVEDNVNLGDRRRRNGGTTALTQVKRDGNSLYSVTVVGEIPPSAVRRVAESVVPAPDRELIK